MPQEDFERSFKTAATRYENKSEERSFFKWQAAKDALEAARSMRYNSALTREQREGWAPVVIEWQKRVDSADPDRR